MTKAITTPDRGIIQGVPRFWILKDGTHDHAFDTRSDAVHLTEGWKPIQEPQILANQRKGAIFERTNDFTYHILDIPIEELQQNVINQAESDRMAKIAMEQEKAITDQFQNITDDEQALENQSVYPIWENLANGYLFVVGKKYQSLHDLETKLFKVIQGHTKQSDWNPVLVPALFSEIVLSNGVEVWTQPTGGDGKYVFGAIVSHNGSTWQNTHAAPSLNVWAPGAFGWTDLGVYP